MNFKIVISVVLSILLATSLVFGTGEEAKAKKEIKCPKKVSVLAVEVTPGSFDQYKGVKAGVLPLKTLDFNSPFDGVVKSIDKAEGSIVKIGDVVLRLDEEAIQKEIKLAATNINKWQQRLKRWSSWKERKPKSEAKAKENIEKYKELLAQKELELKSCALTSPIPGIIRKLNVKEGDQITKDSALGTIINIEKVLVPLTSYTDKVKEGDKIKIKIIDLKKMFNGVVRKSTDERTFLAINNKELQIKPGMKAVFKILFKHHKGVIVLPATQVLKDNTGSYVFVVNEKRAKRVKLELGGLNKGMALIKNGLTVGDEVIISEVLSAKQGTTRDHISCLQDNKKIKVMVKDEAKGKFVKRKKGAVKKPASKVAVAKPAPKTEKPVAAPPKPKKKRVRKIRRDAFEVPLTKFRLGLNASYIKMSSADFSDPYGAITTFGADLGYFITPKLDLWLSFATGSKTGAIPDFPELELKFKYTPIALAARYYLSRSNKLDFYAGAGLSYYSFKETSPIEAVEDSAIGFNLLGGTYYHLTRNISLQMMFRYNIVKKTITEPEVDNELDLSGMELLFGFSINF